MENEEYKPQILKLEEIDHEVNLISAAMSYQSDSDISGIISIDDETSIEVSRINTDNPSTKDVLDKIEGDEKGIQLMDCNEEEEYLEDEEFTKKSNNSYSQIRSENIKRNEKFLKSLGIDSIKPVVTKSVANKKKKSLKLSSTDSIRIPTHRLLRPIVVKIDYKEDTIKDEINNVPEKSVVVEEVEDEKVDEDYSDNDDDCDDDDWDDDDNDDDKDNAIATIDEEEAIITINEEDAIATVDENGRDNQEYYYYDSDDDDNILCNDNTQRKRRRWLPDEDAIILNEREKGVYGYALKAAAKLDGRNATSVLDRYNVVLKKKHDPNAPVRSCVKWTAEEEAIILHEREIDTNGYATRAAEKLEGRSVESVANRWKKFLKKKHPNAPVRSCVKWTAEEDAIILKEREVDVNGYSTRAAAKLDGRSVKSVESRWNEVLKKKYPNAPVRSLVKWTAKEDAIILKEREIDINGYAPRAAEQLEGRNVRSILSHWNEVLKKKHDINDPVRHFVQWTAAEDAIILKEREINTNCFATRAAEQLEGRSVGSVNKRWNRFLKNKHPNAAVKSYSSLAAPSAALAG